MKVSEAELARLEERLKRQRLVRKGITMACPVPRFVSPDAPDSELLPRFKGELLLPEFLRPVWEALRPSGALRDAVAHISLYGGRGGGKSHGVARIAAIALVFWGRRIACCRAVLNSIEESSRGDLLAALDELGLLPFCEVTDRRITCPASGGRAIFRGLDKVGRIKSLAGYSLCLVEESAELKAGTLDILIPTFRVPGAQILTMHNPRLPTDDVEQHYGERTIYQTIDGSVLDIPGENILLRIKCNHDANPWFRLSRLAEEERLMRTEDPDRHATIYGGEFNNLASDQIILPRWFDACLDLHLLEQPDFDISAYAEQVNQTAGFDPGGTDNATSDPSAMAFFLGGSMLTGLEEWKDPDPVAAGQRAYRLAMQRGCVEVRYDPIGVGLGAKGAFREISYNDIDACSFIPVNAADSVLYPEAVYRDRQRNAKAFQNRKAQLWGCLSDRMRNSFLLRTHYNTAVAAGRSHEAAFEQAADLMGDRMSHLFMINSLTISPKLLQKLRGELTAPVWKYVDESKRRCESKAELKQRLGIPSTNLADAVVLTMKPVATLFDTED